MAAKINDIVPAVLDNLDSQSIASVFEDIKCHALIGVDASGIIQNWSSGAEKITGYSCGEAEGQGINFLLTDDDCSKNIAEQFLRKAIENKKASYKGWCIRKNGQQLWCSYSFTALVDDENNITGIALLIADITEEKNSEYKLSMLMEEIEDYAISTMNLNGNIQTWNLGAEKLKGYTAKEIVGKNFSLFYTEKDLQNNRPDGLLEIAFKEGKVSDESWHVRKDGSLFWANTTITAMHNDEQNIIGYSVVTRDRSERKAAEEKLKKHARQIEIKNKEIEQFAFITSHDLQEPLRTVSALTELLASRYTSTFDDTGKKTMQFILDATGRMRHLIKDLLDYSRLGRNSFFTTLNCNDIVRNVLQDLSAVISEMKASFYVEQLPVITGKETEIRLLFQNIITNALKFRRPNVPPVISITAVKENEHKWRFAIQDNGIGIERNNYEKIFLIFKRLHTKTSYEGSGIGLAHCEKIIKMHNGKIWVESTPGEGSTFYFTLYNNLI